MSIDKPRPVRIVQLEVNADDLGMSLSVNRAILRAFHEQLISRASLMANMPGFEDACSLVPQIQSRGRVGAHLNLSEGRPLTGAIAHCDYFCDSSGTFFGTRRERFQLSRNEARAVEHELEAQLQACLDRGVPLSHIDSHHHYHTVWPVSTIVIRLAKRFNIPEVRLAKNCTSGTSAVRKLYKAIHNARLQAQGLAKTSHFGSVDEICTILHRARGPVEVMVHPRLNDAEELIDLDGRDLRAVISQLGSNGPLQGSGFKVGDCKGPAT